MQNFLISLSSELWASVILIFSVYAINRMVSAIIRKRSPVNAHRLHVNLRNTLLILASLGLLSIWGDELRTFLVTILAVMTALVIATREVIVSMLASFAKSFTATPLEIGTLARVRDLRGIVVDKSPLFTTLAEVLPGEMAPQYTGRRVTFPNSWFLTDSLTTEDYTGEYNVHTVTWVTSHSKALELSQVAMAIAQEEYAKYKDKAEKWLADYAKQNLTSVPDAEPRLIYRTAGAGLVDKVELILRMAVPQDQKQAIEQKLILAMLSASVEVTSQKD